MAIKYFNDGTDYRLSQRGKTAEWLRNCVGSEGYRPGAINYVFCSSERLLEMNRQYLGHDYLTDVITFDYSDLVSKRTVSGDVFIDPATVADNALVFNSKPEVEMRRVLIHGVLHLCGYGDKTEKESKLMRSKEDLYLALFENI